MPGQTDDTTRQDASQLLARELHHRIKNQLNIVCSMLALKTASIDDPQAVSALLQARVQISALAAMHDHLLRGEHFPHTDPAEYLDELASYMRDNLTNDGYPRIRIRVSAPAMEPNRLFLLGLASCELITNCIRHAFRNGRGVIDLSLENTGGGIILAVEDNGVGLPPDFSLDRVGGGLEIVKGLAQQLGGSLRTEPAQGARLVISAPLA